MADPEMRVRDNVLELRIGSETVRPPIGAVPRPTKITDGSPYGDEDRASWDEFRLVRDPAGALWLEHARYDWGSYSGRKARFEPYWMVSRDGGRTWGVTTKKPSGAKPLGSLSTRL